MLIDLTDQQSLRVESTAEPALVRERLAGVKIALALCDVVALSVIATTLGLAMFGRPTAVGGGVEVGGGNLAAVSVFALVPLLWNRVGMYWISQRRSLLGVAQRVALGVGALLLCVFSVIVILNVQGTSRLYLGLFGVSTFVYALMARLAARSLVRRRQADEKKRTRTLLIGGGINAERFLVSLDQHPEMGMEMVGSLGSTAVGAHRHLGDIADLRHVLITEVVDEVVICLPFEQWATIRDCAQIVEEQGKTVRIPMGLMDDMRSRNRVDQIGDVSMLSLVSTPDDVLQNGMKRAMDLVGAAAGLLLTLPFLLVAALAVKLSDGGPVFFSQDRVGLHGRIFKMVKLRTMVEDAEERLNEVAHLNERDSAAAFKASDDPRITRVGRVLRRASLDEIPQFWNVLTGDMSLVGPRPPLMREVVTYDYRHRRRLSVKPGITGLWQVSSRNEPSFESWVELDLDYIDSWSPIADLHIIARTIPAVLRRTGT